jgi:protease-4
MKDLISSILNILRYMGRILSLVRNTVFNTIFLIILLVFIVSFFTSSDFTIQDNSILKLSLSGDIVEERHPSAPFDSFFEESFGIESQPKQLVLTDILQVIQAAGNDPAISAILLDMKGFGHAGLNQMHSIGTALNQFKNTGKKVIAAQDIYTQKQYYLASYADEIILNPMGVVELHGFGVYPLYFKEALEKLRVNYHVFRVGSYKSAIEPITRNSMSDEARSQNAEWLNALWKSYTDDVTRQRGLPANSLTNYIENIGRNLEKTAGDTAQMALENGLVDKLFTREEFNNYLKSLTDTSSVATVSLEEYLDYIAYDRLAEQPDDNGVAIIVAEGNILGGKQPAGVIGSDSLSALIKSTRDDDDIKGVVLRVNSGGGSAFASEIIRQEILELKKAGKPVVVSMGTMAASGGYWISADADQIWASPSTITGSIGIFGAFPTFERTLASVGVQSDGVGTTSLSAGMNLTQSPTPALLQSIQLTVNNGYSRFLSIVQNGRNISGEELPIIAEGRVFSGSKAKELKLVDNLGSLDDAIKATATLAGLDDYVPVYVERETTVRDQILAHLTSSFIAFFPGVFDSPKIRAISTLIQNELSEISLLSDPHGIYAHAMLQLHP